MTTESRPEPPAGIPRQAVRSSTVPVRSHRHVTLASVALATAGAVAAIGVAVAFRGPAQVPTTDDQAVVLLDVPVAPPSSALVTRAWSDDDADGLRGDAEPPLAGVVVRLETAEALPARHVDGREVEPRTTGRHGTAAFDELAPGVYRVRYVLPAGFSLTTAVAAPGHAGADSDAEPVDTARTEGLSGPVALTDPAALALPGPDDGVTADRVLRGVDVGAVPAAEVLDVAGG